MVYSLRSKIKYLSYEYKTYGLVYAIMNTLVWCWWYPLKHGIKNLIKYFPLVWKDRDWDSHFWLKWNLKKLESMEYNIRNNGNHTRCEYDADKIHLAVLLLRRLVKDEYLENVMKTHESKWGETDMVFTPCDHKGNQLPKDTKDAKLYSMEMVTEKAITEKQKKQETKERRRLYKHSEYLKNQDLEYFNKIINKYLWNWWD